MISMLDSWKKEHCAQFGHPLELRDGYMTRCLCGERFGAVENPDEVEMTDG